MAWELETRRWDMNTMKQIVERRKIKKGILLICASETHENCKHDEDEIVLRKGTRIDNVCFYESLKKIVVYLKTPQKGE